MNTSRGNQEKLYTCFIPPEVGCKDPHGPASKKKYMPICGCYYLCVSCYEIFFRREDTVITCNFCQFDSPKELFFALTGSFLQEDEDFERANNRVNKVFNHSRNQLESLEKYNQYQEQKLETAYNLFAKNDLKEVEASLDSFALSNRSSIAENNSNPQYENKNAYILEEFKRVSKNKIHKERLVDRYYRSYIDEKGFAAETKTLVAENTAKPVQSLVATEIKDARSYAYTPNLSKAQQQVNQTFQFPKPVLSEEDLKNVRYVQAKKLHSNVDYYNASKEAGGWTSNMMVSRCKENAFKCLFI
jgi:hypothetical protein